MMETNPYKAEYARIHGVTYGSVVMSEYWPWVAARHKDFQRLYNRKDMYTTGYIKDFVAWLERFKPVVRGDR